MNELVIISGSGQSVTTSKIVAEIFGKNHKEVLRDIKSLSCSEEFGQRNFALSSYFSEQNKELPMYEITKDGFSFLVMGYTGTKAGEFKEMFISEFNKREALLRDPDYILNRAHQILSERIKIAEQQLMQKEERLQLQQHEIQKAAPKVEYYEKVLQSEGLIPTNVIAKEMGMSAVTLNKLLHQRGIIYRSGFTWVLYSKYENKGYTGTKTFNFTDSLGHERSTIQTYWTEKGREFIHNAVKQKAVV